MAEHKPENQPGHKPENCPQDLSEHWTGTGHPGGAGHPGGKGKPAGPSSEGGEARRLRYTRTPLTGPLVLSAEHLRLLRFLAECRFLSLPQLARLTGLPEKGARRRLRVLFDAGLVDVIPVSRVALAPVEASNDASLLFGSAPNIYALTGAGVKLLAQDEILRGELPSRKASGSSSKGSEARSYEPKNYGPKNGLFLAHELAVRDVRVWLEAVRRERRGKPQIARWQVGPEAMIRESETSRGWSVRPDAWFVFELTDNARPVVLVGLVEVDRGTERGDRHWAAKLAGYHALFDEQAALTAATGFVNARVLVFTPTAHRRDRLAALLIELVQEAGFPADLLGRFWLAEHAVLGQSDLTKPVWRRPGTGSLLPLVPPGVLPPATP